MGPAIYRPGRPIKIHMTSSTDQATDNTQAIKEEAKKKALKKLEVKREIKKEIDEKIKEKVESGADQSEVEACIIFSDAHGLPIEDCLTASELDEFN